MSISPYSQLAEIGREALRGYLEPVLCCVLLVLTGAVRPPVVPKTLQQAIVTNNLQHIGRIITSPGFDIDARDSSGKTALHYAAQLANRRLVEKLISCYADVQLHDNDGKLPYDYVVGEGGQEIEQEALATREFPRSRRAKQNAERAAVAAVLLKATVGTRGSDAMGRSPLYWAVLSKDRGFVHRLLEAGAEVGSEEGQSAVEMAIQTRQRYMLDQLVKAGGGAAPRCCGQ